MDKFTEEPNIFSLPNELHEHIFSFLSFNGLKNLRLTCKYFNNAIVNLSAFVELSNVNINHSHVSDIAESIRQNKNQLRFRNVKFSGHKCPEAAYILNQIATHVEQLTLNCVDIFKVIGAIKLPNLERLYVSGPEGRSCLKWKLNTYKNLNSIHLRPFHRYLSSHNHILEESIESHAGKIKSLTVVCRDNQTLVSKVLMLNANSLNYLNIYLYDHPEARLRERWNKAFQNMIDLKTLLLIGDQFFGDWIDETLKVLPETAQLNCITLEGRSELTDDILIFIAERFQNSLQEANFPGNQDMTSRGLEELLRKAHNLKKLNISGRTVLNSESFAFDRKAMLQELNLSHSKLTENCICRLAENLPNLVVLNIECCDCCSDKALAYIFRYQTRLRALIFAGCDKITDSGLMGFGEKAWSTPMPISRLKHLETLDLRQVTKLTDKPFHGAIVFKQLRNICLCWNSKITNEAINCLTKNCPTIEKLILHKCTLLTVDVIDLISINLKNLRNFSMDSASYNGDDFQGNLKSLKDKYSRNH